jgi:hypothetical protein
MSKYSSSLLEGRHQLRLMWSFCRPCGLPDRFLFSLTLLTIFCWGFLVPMDWQTASARNDRERINRTRQNAEDLFKPKQRPPREDVPTSAPNDAPSEHQPRRQPRVLAILPVVPMDTAEVEPTAEPKQKRRPAAIRRETRGIPASQFGRVRALTRYGMTRAQVAELYGVTVDEIERIISRPG